MSRTTATAATATTVTVTNTSHTICGYGWGDVQSALQKAVTAANMDLSQRWAAELVCSEGGLGRLEATLFHIWAAYVGLTNAPGWPQTWFKNLQHIRLIWTRAGGDIKAVRNTPSVRQSVAEVVAWLVLAPKRNLPALPKPEDCFRESEAVRARIRSGAGAGDQLITKRIWTAGQDGPDLKTIGNELEAALRGNQTPRLLFWTIWLLTLDTLKDTPTVKERAPPEITGKQRKSVAWFLVEMCKEFLSDLRVLTGEDMRAVFDMLITTWAKLGTKGRRDVFAALLLFIQERSQKSLTLVTPPTPKPPTAAMQTAMGAVDKYYTEIAEEARRFIAETPEITGLTPEAALARQAAKAKPITSTDKLAMAYQLLH